MSPRRRAPGFEFPSGRAAARGFGLFLLLTLARNPLAPSALGAAPAAPPPAPAASVVINEVMYHPPGDRDDLQWVELHNPGTERVDLAGWKFTEGLGFTFTNSTVLAPGGYLVISRDRGAFYARYGRQLPVVGDFQGRLKHGGERLRLVDAQGRPVDSVRFDDQEPWPVSPDGASASLERIVATGPGDSPANWAPSPLPALTSPAGTPGRPNAAARTNSPPWIQDVTLASTQPGSPLPISARVSDPDGVREVRVLVQVLSAAETFRGATSAPPREQVVPLARAQGDAANGVWSGSLPPVEAGRLLRYRLVAVDGTGGERTLPHPHDLRPTFSAWVGPNASDARIPAVSLWLFGPPESPGASLRTGGFPGPQGARARAPREPARGQAVAIYQPPGGGPVQVYDHIRVTPRQGGWKVRFHKDRMAEGMSVANVIFEFHPRYVLAEHLAYELYRSAGVPTPLSTHWRIGINGRPMGYHLVVEQPNSTFLRRVGLDPDGDLFKLLWYGGDVIGQHEKKNNPETGHAHLVETIDLIGQRRREAQWQVIDARFEVDECATYYAVNMCLQNWDGFFNNYFVYRGPGPAGKYAIIPWDEDKTWGDFDGAPAQYDWYTMPLTLGMAGDQPDHSFSSRFNGGSGPFGGTQWWRPPGFFSGPLLGNPTFRARFLQRLRQLCENEFTPAKFEPVIAGLEHRLEPEIRHRAQVVGRSRNRQDEFRTPPEAEGNAAPALEQFQRHIGSFRRQVQHRREFLLKALAQEK